MDKVKDCPNGEDEDPSQVDECDLGKDNCDKPRADCTNIVNGGYACKCKAGFVGDGFKCQRQDFIATSTGIIINIIYLFA